MSSPVRVWPVLQEYVATDSYVVVGADTVPFTGLSSVPQSTTAEDEVLNIIIIIDPVFVFEHL